MHYEVERRELAYERDDANVLRITGMRWRTVTAFRYDAARTRTPLTFDDYDSAAGHAERSSPDRARIVLVDDRGGRTVVG